MVCWEDSKETPVECFVLETATVVGRCVELTAWGLLGVPKVVWVTEVPVTTVVDLVAVVVGPAVD